MISPQNSTGEKGPVMPASGADLGLFNQLLQMVDGDWSDSVQGICTHLHEHFEALGILLSVYDKSYNEFIFISYSIDPQLKEILKNHGYTIEADAAFTILKKAYETIEGILENRLFQRNDILRLGSELIGDREKAETLVGQMKINSIAAVPALDTNKKFKCFFHIMTQSELTEKDRQLIDSYRSQLNVALEIVFLVRELYIRATHDGLTRLFNHKQGEILLIREMERVKRNNSPITLVMMDIDHFKSVNDQYGHPAGDEVLQFMGGLLMDRLRKCDIMSRYGGEEFLIALPDTDLKSALEVIRRLKETIARHVFQHNGSCFSITASFGMAQYDPEQHRDSGLLIGAADLKLYEAKQNGRDRIEY